MAVAENVINLPPQNLDAERSVLGAILLDNRIIDHVTDLIVAEDFYRDAHAKIFSAMLAMSEEEQSIDYLTLEDKLKNKGELDLVGGPTYLAKLTDAVPSIGHVTAYAKVISEKATLRRLIHSCSTILRSAHQDSENLDEHIGAAERMIFEVVEKRSTTSYVHLKTLVKESFVEIEKLYERTEQYTGVPTGFKDLDDKTSGLQKGDLVIIAARPSMGKTSFALNIAQNAATRFNIPTLFFSLEMSKEALAMRMLCTESRVNYHSLRQGIISDSDWGRLARVAGQLSEADLYIDDTPAIKVIEMRARARRLQAELRKQDRELGLICIDYMQLASPPKGRESREREISEISRSLKGLAKELGLPVISLSQLSRKVESRENKRPQLSDLRESGAIEQDADVIMFIYRDDYYNEESEDKGIAEIIIGKQRNGPTGVARLQFTKEFTQFSNLAEDRDY